MPIVSHVVLTLFPILPHYCWRKEETLEVQVPSGRLVTLKCQIKSNWNVSDAYCSSCRLDTESDVAPWLLGGEGNTWNLSAKWSAGSDMELWRETACLRAVFGARDADQTADKLRRRTTASTAIAIGIRAACFKWINTSMRPGSGLVCGAVLLLLWWHTCTSTRMCVSGCACNWVNSISTCLNRTSAAKDELDLQLK